VLFSGPLVVIAKCVPFLTAKSGTISIAKLFYLCFPLGQFPSCSKHRISLSGTRGAIPNGVGVFAHREGGPQEANPDHEQIRQRRWVLCLNESISVLLCFGFCSKMGSPSNLLNATHSQFKFFDYNKKSISNASKRT
jgi:hypothetical protein